MNADRLIGTPRLLHVCILVPQPHTGTRIHRCIARERPVRGVDKPHHKSVFTALIYYSLDTPDTPYLLHSSSHNGVALIPAPLRRAKTRPATCDTVPQNEAYAHRTPLHPSIHTRSARPTCPRCPIVVHSVTHHLLDAAFHPQRKSRLAHGDPSHPLVAPSSWALLLHRKPSVTIDISVLLFFVARPGAGRRPTTRHTVLPSQAAPYARRLAHAYSTLLQWGSSHRSLIRWVVRFHTMLFYFNSRFTLPSP